jgi:ribose transport system permease protein
MDQVGGLAAGREDVAPNRASVVDEPGSTVREIGVKTGGESPEPTPSDTSRGAAAVGKLLPERVWTVLWSMRRGTVLFSFIAMIILFAVLNPDSFLDVATLRNVLDLSAEPAIVAAGVAILVAGGQLDLSFAAASSFVGGMVVVLMAQSHVGIWPAVLLSLVAVAVVGAIIGGIVSAGRASAFIITLAVSSVYAGLEMGLTGNTTIYNGIPSGFLGFATAEFLGFKVLDWVAVVLVLVCAVLLHATRFGRHTQAIGDNKTAANFAGVPVARVTIIGFVLLAVLSGIGGIFAVSRAQSYYPGAAGNLLLSSFSAVLLGAAASKHGRFTIGGSVLGVLWFVTLQAGLAQLNVASWLTNLLEGLVLACAVLFAAAPRVGIDVRS